MASALIIACTTAAWGRGRGCQRGGGVGQEPTGEGTSVWQAERTDESDPPLSLPLFRNAARSSSRPGSDETVNARRVDRCVPRGRWGRLPDRASASPLPTSIGAAFPGLASLARRGARPVNAPAAPRGHAPLMHQRACSRVLGTRAACARTAAPQSRKWVQTRRNVHPVIGNKAC